MSSHNKDNRRLQELGDSNFEIVDGQPDIRGWDVKDSSGRKVGEVDELIFDVESRKVRYIVVDLEGNTLDLEDKDVLIPIGLAELHKEDDDVILNNVTAEQLRALPDYDDDDLDSDFENNIRNVFSGTGASIAGSASAITNSSNNTPDFYAHDHFNDNLSRHRSVVVSSDEHVRMRQEPSFLESEGTTHRDIDDDVDGMQDQRIEMDERDAIPVTNSTTLRSGNDIDEWDTTDENTPPRTNTDIQRDNRNNNE